jgi:hypothetical protein
MVRKFGKLYKVLSKKGKNLGTATTKEAAEKRLRQVEHFKKKKKKPAGHWGWSDDAPESPVD